MQQTTMTLEQMNDLEIPIFSEEFLASVAENYDDVFTAEKWNKLSQRFYLKYKYREIGCETVNKWYDVCHDVFVSIIDKYKFMWKNIITDMYNNQKLINESEIVNADLPHSEIDELVDFASNKSKSSVTSEARNDKTEVDMFDNFFKKYIDTDDKFLQEFNITFMGVFQI